MGSNPTGGHGCVCCERCVLSGRGLCDGLITRQEKSCRMGCVVCDLEIAPRILRAFMDTFCNGCCWCSLIFPLKEYRFVKNNLETSIGNCLHRMTFRMFMFISYDLQNVYVYIIWPSECLCLYHMTFRMFMFISYDLQNVYVYIIWPSECLCLYHMTFRMFMFISYDLQNVYVYIIWPSECLCLYHMTFRTFN